MAEIASYPFIRHLPAPEEDRLAFFVREPWPSAATSIELDEGLIASGGVLTVQSELRLVS